MKLEVGRKYRMKDYLGDYEYVVILGMEKDIGIDDGKSYYLDDNGIDLYHGVIVYKTITGDLSRMPDLLVWGANGEWDGAFPNDRNALICDPIG